MNKSASVGWRRTALIGPCATVLSGCASLWPQTAELREGLPDSVIVLNNLAQTLSEQGRDREALPFIERAAAAGRPFAETVRQTRQTIAHRIAAANPSREPAGR